MQCYSGGYLATCLYNYFASQIGPNWALTAAHCVHDAAAEADLPANSLSLVLGVHDRTNLTARARCHILAKCVTIICAQKSVC